MLKTFANNSNSLRSDSEFELFANNVDFPRLRFSKGPANVAEKNYWHLLVIGWDWLFGW